MIDDGYAVRVHGLGKRYEMQRRSSRGALYDLAGSLLSRGNGESRHKGPTIWAFRHVEFEVQRGEIFAVIGRNGSGKTTLLSILANVTAPTEGYAEVRGRVAPLLQVGAGFHPQLTGRDNIALSGAILGMTQEEVEARFEQIVDFSQIGDFVDQPVKHYSNGMYTRLAYSVAAFLPAEIMLIDEVLAVGDAQFQRKSHEHMSAALQDGRSVVYVGHNLNVVRDLAHNAIVLDEGTVAFSGRAGDAADFYEQEVTPRHRILSAGGPGSG